MDPNLGNTYHSELYERLEDFSAIWPRLIEECARFDDPKLEGPEVLKNRWRIPKYAADLLVTCAQIGRILNPHAQGSDAFKEACRARGAELRSELKVPDDSPLLENSLRNALEHIDEYIDGWIRENPTRPLQTWAFTTTAPGEAPLESTIRRIHVRTFDVFVLGKRANLRAMHDAVQSLGRALPAVHRSEMVMRFDDPATGGSDVIRLSRVLGEKERPKPESRE